MPTAVPMTDFPLAHGDEYRAHTETVKLDAVRAIRESFEKVGMA